MGTKRPTLFKYLSPARDIKSCAILARTQASKQVGGKYSEGSSFSFDCFLLSASDDSILEALNEEP